MGRYHVEGLGIDGNIIENRMGSCGVDSSGSGQDQLRARVNTVMNLRVS
jgi:hypothetical protein